jgi:acyl-CoA synthetase (NDP forming)
MAVASEGSTVGNPIGLAGSANARQYGSVLEIVLADDAVDSVVVTYTEPSLRGSDEVAEAVAAVASQSAKPVLANFVSTEATLRALRQGPRRVPWFAYPETAARALARIVPYARWRGAPEGTAPEFEDVDAGRARGIVATALAGGALWLDTATVLALLEAYGISAVPARGPEMSAAPDGVEVVVGLFEDESFGPLVTFGLGGDEAELLGDRVWSLVPMTRGEAEELVTGSRSSPLLTGHGGAAPVDVGGLVDLVLRVARLAEDLPEVVELSLSPVIASPDGVAVLDARVRVAEVSRDPALLRRAMRMT